MAKIAPSILAADFARLAEDCERACAGAENPMFHIDIMDGVFVPNISIGPDVLAALKRELPDVFYDVHLMIINPEKYVESFVRAGADSITFHIEADTDILGTLAAIKARGCKGGLSLRPGTAVEELYKYLDKIDFILVMSVEPGFGGQVFNPAAPPRIAKIKKEIRRRDLNVEVGVDGGINGETGKLCVEAGADVLIAGNYIFKSSSPAAKMEELANL